MTLYGLAGFPTRTKVTLQEAQDRLVGTRFYALGGGIEGSYSFIKSKEKLLAGIIQIRTIHFFSRSFQPVLPPGGKIQPGQGTDILLSIRYRKDFTLFETGYNPTIFTNQAVILPNETLETKTAVRHGTYANIAHLTKIRIFGKRLAVGAGFLFSRLSRLDLNNVSAWISLTLII